METKQALDRISRLGEKEVGPTEEDVKQKIVVPLLEILGHKREDLDFEHRTRSGGRIDITIKNVPHDCKVIIDTKNYAEQLQHYVEQIKQYAFDENALLAVLVNGTDLRIYSPLKGIAFERSLLYLIRRKEIGTECAWGMLLGLLGKDGLCNRGVFQVIETREQEIRQAMSKEEHLREECSAKTEEITGSIEEKQEEIEDLEKQAAELEENWEKDIAQIWKCLALPYDWPREPDAGATGRGAGEQAVSGRARKVRLQELVDAGLVKGSDRVYLFCRGRGRVGGEQARIVARENKLKYDKDGQRYSVSRLAGKLLRKHGVIRTKHDVAGPLYWQTEDGRTLHELNEQVRRHSQKRM